MIFGAYPYFPEDSINSILNEIKLVLKGGRLTEGPYVQEFEQKFAEYNDVKYALAVNSGTASLDCTLRHYRLNGREVIVPTNTFISTPNAVLLAGGKPVFADMNEETLGIDVEDAKRKITSKTAGIIVVHIAGLVCPQIHELRQFCDEKGLFLIEDAAHAHGAMMNNQKAGTFGHAGCFSFYPTKVMTSCEGGMIITNDQQLADEARCLRTCGQNSERQAVMLGHNWRLSEMAAVVGRHQLEKLEEFIAKRNQVAVWYGQALADVKGVSPLHVPEGFRCSYYKYPIKLAEGIDRVKVGSILKEKYGVEPGHVYYPPCHLMPFYKNTFGTKEGDLPTAERVLKQVLCLPMHYAITQENVLYVRDALVSALTELKTA
ncbi:MAG: DegT/DnrJ/EryC1/StrS family aminotransferase [Candidatus Bathyarchaeota archaeon]|nr:DegT/DnrJ/EryC1/StrS family aminotransferase [Candidatus Bathyarchaeota archaeon]